MKLQLRVFITTFFVTLFITAVGWTEVITEEIEYRDGDTRLVGYLAYDDSRTGEAPGVLICHQWMGLTDHERDTAKALAKLGYVAFALDMYGAENRPSDRSQAQQQTSQFYQDRSLLLRRVELGLEQLRKHNRADDDRIAAIGFCFGGTVVLELARSGADISGVVSLHGGLNTSKPAQAGDINAEVLALHGAADPHVPQEEVNVFINEMSDANVDWHLIVYGDAVHSFTQRAAGDDPSRGSAYDADAARRAWTHMNAFFDDIFGNEPGRRKAANPWADARN